MPSNPALANQENCDDIAKQLIMDEENRQIRVSIIDSFTRLILIVTCVCVCVCVTCIRGTRLVEFESRTIYLYDNMDNAQEVPDAKILEEYVTWMRSLNVPNYAFIEFLAFSFNIRTTFTLLYSIVLPQIINYLSNYWHNEL